MGKFIFNYLVLLFRSCLSSFNFMSEAQPDRDAMPCDRLCNDCGNPMIGIMKVSDPKPPRKICSDCGGKSKWDGLEPVEGCMKSPEEE